MREVLDRTRAELEKLRGDVERYVGPLELPEPGEEDVAAVRRLMERQLGA